MILLKTEYGGQYRPRDPGELRGLWSAKYYGLNYHRANDDAHGEVESLTWEEWLEAENHK